MRSVWAWPLIDNSWELIYYKMWSWGRRWAGSRYPIQSCQVAPLWPPEEVIRPVSGEKLWPIPAYGIFPIEFSGVADIRVQGSGFRFPAPSYSSFGTWISSRRVCGFWCVNTFRVFGWLGIDVQGFGFGGFEFDAQPSLQIVMRDAENRIQIFRNLRFWAPKTKFYVSFRYVF